MLMHLKKGFLTYPFGSGFGEKSNLAFAFDSSLCESETDPSRFGRKICETSPDILPEDQFPEKSNICKNSRSLKSKYVNIKEWQ